jgi:hypothetical protein
LTSDITCQYLRSVNVYDELNTSIILDALWLSDDVKTAYTDIYMAKNGKGEDRRMPFLRRQLEENQHSISFYVLVPDRIILGDPLSVWSVYLTIDEYNYSPLDIKEVDLDVIYQSFFGRRYNDFKREYLITFDAYDAQDQPLITAESRMMTLVFRSLCKEIKLEWLLAPTGKVVFQYPSDNYPCNVSRKCYESCYRCGSSRACP